MAGAGRAWQPHDLGGQQAIAVGVEAVPRLCWVGQTRLRGQPGIGKARGAQGRIPVGLPGLSWEGAALHLEPTREHGLSLPLAQGQTSSVAPILVSPAPRPAERLEVVARGSCAAGSSTPLPWKQHQVLSGHCRESRGCG